MKTGTGLSDRAARARLVGTLAVALILVGSSLVVYGVGSASASPSTAAPAASAPIAAVHGAVSAPAARATAPSSAPAAPRPSLSASGTGTFFDNENLSQPGVGQQFCYKYAYGGSLTCGNTTMDPSINITGSGTIGVAYDAISNYTNCPSVANISNFTSSVIAFQSSTTNGASWSSPVYLSNQNCSAGLNLTDGWEPTLTSLANGTFVLAYTEFGVYTYPGCIGCTPDYVPDVYAYDVSSDDLVVQESYNGGATWTAPDIVNASVNPFLGSCTSSDGWPAFHPSIAASGSNVFLAWSNITDEGCYATTEYSAAVQYVYSTNGGLNWSAPTTLPSIGGQYFSSSELTSYSVDPWLISTSSGAVYLAYATGLNYSTTPLCFNNTCYYGLFTMDIEVANATNGTGAAWTVQTAAAGFPVDVYDSCGGYYCPMYGDNLQIGWNGISGQLYLTYGDYQIGNFCFSDGYCYNEITPAVAFQNSSTNGATWSRAHGVGDLIDGNGGAYSEEWFPTLTVDHNGTVQYMLSFYNESICQFVLIYNYSYCGSYVQVYLNSTNNGSSWSNPVIVSPWFVYPTNYPYRGEYDTAAVASSGQVFFAWADSTCTATTLGPFCDYLDPYEPEPNTTVVVSWLFEGTGITLNFTQSGLPAGAPWSVDLLGNIRQGTTTLSISGVPTAQTLLWSVPWVNLTYGITWQATPAAGTPVAPAAFTTNTTLAYTFTEFLKVVVAINPPFDDFYLTAGYNEANWDMTPLPGTYWVAANTSFTETVAPQALSCASFCYFYNLTWVSWTGTGNGSVSTNATALTFTVTNTPVNETANWLFNGYCEVISGTSYCYGVGNYPLTYHESGLPSGTTWGVTSVLNSSAIGLWANESSSAWLNITTGQTAVQYTAWTVPASAGQVWVATSTSPASPVKEPEQTLVNVSYSLVNPASQTFVANFTAEGLPMGTSWSADVGNGSYAVTDGNLSVDVPGGLAMGLNGSPVYTENGVGYYAASVSVLPYVVNETWTNTTTLPDNWTFDGSAHVYVYYAPMYWLQVTASGGGVVSPSDRWVQDGASVALTATPDPGYHFLDWTSAGPGGTTTAQSHNTTPTIRPTGPVSEFATFRLNPSPTWNVTVVSAGLPSGTGFTFTLGTGTYSTTNGTTTVGELENGTYAFAAQDSYSESSNGTRWVATSWNASYGAPGALGLSIRSNGTIWVNYTTQYVLTVASTPDGTVTPSPLVGSTWENASTSVDLMASPSYHYKFVGWNASGLGSVKGPDASIAVTMEAPVWESATFEYRVFPAPATYALSVTETGLPTGTGWNVTAGVGNASQAGATATLTLTGLNGSYMLTVATVYTALGTRYVANGSAPVPVRVTANRSATVAFALEYALTVSSGTGGTVGGTTGTTWVASGASEALEATAASGYMFVGWNGTGTGSYTGSAASPTVTVGGPVNETASFAPVVPKAPSASATAGQPAALGILAVLLVVGLVVGLVLGRRGGGKSGASAGEPSPEEGTPAESGEAGSEPPMDDTYGGAPPPSDGVA